MRSHIRRHAVLPVVFVAGIAIALSGCARVEVKPEPKIGIAEKGVGEGTPTPGEVLMVNDQSKAITFRLEGQKFSGQFADSFTVEKECKEVKAVPEKTTEICKFTVNAKAGQFVKNLKATLDTSWKFEGEANNKVIETPVEME